MSEYELIHYPEIPGINVFFNTVDYRTAHFHPEWELLWVVDQSLNVTRGRQDFFAPEDSVLLIPPRASHQFQTAGNSCTFLCLQVSPRCFRTAFPGLEYLTVENLLADPFWTPEQRQRCRTLLLELAQCYFDRPPFYELYIQARAAELLHLALSSMEVRQISPGQLKEQSRRTARLSRLLSYVDEHYTETIRLADFAREEQCSLSYLSRFVKEMLNQTFQEYVETVRFNAACKLIAAGERKMVDVYAASGFSDYRYFSRAFRQRTGLTPEEYARGNVTPETQHVHVHQSIHSLERFYSREQCRRMTQALKKGDRTAPLELLVPGTCPES